MTHRLYVTWHGHRAGLRTKPRKTLPGLRRTEWAYGGGTPMERGQALAVAAELRGRGHTVRVVGLAGVELVIVPKMHPLFAVMLKESRKPSPPPAPKAKAERTNARQPSLFGGAA